MSHRRLITLLFLLAGSVLPVAAGAQQPDAKQNQDQVQSQTIPPQTTPVQPERTPQQSAQARQQDNRSAEDTRINRDWTTRQRSDQRLDMDRQRPMDRMDGGRDDRTAGRTWHHYDDEERGSRYGRMDRDDDRYDYDRPQRRVKICVEYDNGDEFCRYRD